MRNERHERTGEKRMIRVWNGKEGKRGVEKRRGKFEGIDGEEK